MVSQAAHEPAPSTPRGRAVAIGAAVVMAGGALWVLTLVRYRLRNGRPAPRRYTRIAVLDDSISKKRR